MGSAGIGEREGGGVVAARAQLGLLFAINAVLFFAIIGLSAAVAPAGLLGNNNLSSFGVLPETTALFNIGLVAVGVLDIFTAGYWRRSNSGLLMPVVFIIAGAGAIATGVVNVDIEKHVHAVVSAVGFLGHVSMPLVLGLGSRSLTFRLLSYLSALISIAFLASWVVGMLRIADAFAVFGKGETQVLILLPVVLWTFGFGIYLMMSAKSGTAEEEGAAVRPARR